MSLVNLSKTWNSPHSETPPPWSGYAVSHPTPDEDPCVLEITSFFTTIEHQHLNRVTFLRITLGTNSDLNFVQKLIGFFPRLETLEIILAEFSIGQNADIVVKSTPSENPTLLKSLIIRIAKESKIAFAEKKNEIVMLCEILGINVIQNVDRIYLEDSGRLLPYMFYLYDWKKLTRVHFPYACQEILEKLTLLPSSLNELKLDNISNLYWLEKVMTRHMSSIVILDVSLFTDDITHPEQSEFPKLSRLEKLSYSIGKREGWRFY